MREKSIAFKHSLRNHLSYSSIKPAHKMVQLLLPTVTLLAFLATTAADFAAYVVVSPEKCQPECQVGQACTEHEVVCITAPCNPEHVCASRAKENHPNPCNPEVCPQDTSCVPATSPDGLPIAACVPPCWVKNCRNNVDQTCVMKACNDGYDEATCVPVKEACDPDPTITCALVFCATSPCKMIDCDPQCPPLV